MIFVYLKIGKRFRRASSKVVLIKLKGVPHNWGFSRHLGFAMIESTFEVITIPKDEIIVPITTKGK